jgi:hypothetical protein
MSAQDLAAIVAAIATGLAGVTAMLRFLVIHYLSEMKPNSGSSMRDEIQRISQRVDDLYKILIDRQ